jgi:hypothetical protein
MTRKPKTPTRKALQSDVRRLAKENATLAQRLSLAESDASHAKEKLRGMFRSSVRRAGDDPRVIEAVARIDASLPYADSAGVVVAALAGLVHQLATEAPQLVIGLERNVLKRIRDYVGSEHDYYIYGFFIRLLRDNLLPPHTTFDDFRVILTTAAAHEHLLEILPSQDSYWPGPDRPIPQNRQA